MNLPYIRTLYDYNDWANQRILSAAAGLPPEQFASASLGYCNLRDTLVHILSAERRWRLRWEGEPTAPMLDPQDFPSVASVRERWQSEAQLMRTYLATLSPDDLTETFTYVRTQGRSITSRRWHTMAQMITHGTQHRGELAMLLTGLGRSPGNLDFIVYVDEQGAM